MRFDAEQEVLESVFVEMDPILHGFRGVLVELVGAGEGYVLLETAAGTGNRLLRFSSRRTSSWPTRSSRPNCDPRNKHAVAPHTKPGREVRDA